jgi:hypothetical protein
MMPSGQNLIHAKTYYPHDPIECYTLKPGFLFHKTWPTTDLLPKQQYIIIQVMHASEHDNLLHTKSSLVKAINQKETRLA